MIDPSRPSAIERALELARSGDFADTKRVRDALRREGYEDVDMIIAGSVAKQVVALCRAARRGPAG